MKTSLYPIARVLGLISIFTGHLLICSCGGSGSDSSNSSGIRPSSLNGITLRFQGANLTFSSPTPNALSGGVETGGIVYSQTSNTKFTFIPTDPTILDPPTLSWPVDLGTSAYYEYRPLDGNTGEIRIYSSNKESNTILNHLPGTGGFDIFIVSFNANGTTIPSAGVVITVTNPVKAFLQFQATLELGSFTTQPRAVPIAWNGENKGPGYIASSSFHGKVLNLQDSSDDLEIQFGPFIATSEVIFQGTQTTESGNVSITQTEDIGLPDPLLKTFNASYTAVQPFGTENVIMSLRYVSSTENSPLPADETLTLTYKAGETLSGSGDVLVRTGSYVKGTRTGIFIQDAK
jgi:hypothetical protein